jgi:hypothetical protein
MALAAQLPNQLHLSKNTAMKKMIFLSLILVLAQQSSIGQTRQFLREKIAEWGSCKNVAMTLTGGDVALIERNGWAATGIPAEMTEELEMLNDKDELIDDVVLTEEGNWLVLWGNNGVTSSGVPRSLDDMIGQWNEEAEIIYSITFNDEGDWIMISADKYSASDAELMEWIGQGEQEFGELWAAHLTNTGLVVVYENGYKFLGDVPDNLVEKLKETDLDVFRLKFLSDGSYFIADKDGNYVYFL